MPKSWSADEIFSLTRGYQGACVLLAAAELDVFGVLADGPLAAAEVAQRIGGDQRATTVLLDALAGMQLLDKQHGEYRAAEGVLAALTAAGASSMLAMVQHHANCMRRWSLLAEVVKSGRPAPRRPSVRGEAGDQESFIEAMNDINHSAADPLVKEIAPARFDHLLDVGGGSGTWTIAWLETNPTAKATIFDLPHVMPMAERRMAEAGMSDRVTLAAGDFETDPLPRGADLAWVSAIIHQNSRRQNRELYSKVAEALVDGGRIMIRDIVMDESRIDPPGGAMFAINMLVGTEGGGTFTAAEIRGDLESAGFGEIEQLRSDPWMNSIVSAVKRPV